MQVLIVGASIAGPALAFWLNRYGHEVTVVERAPALREGGYCVDIRGAALDVIDRMGLREAIRPYEADTLENAMVDESGRRFGKTARGFGVIDARDIEVPRGDLARVLYEATRGDTNYRFGDTVTDIRQHDGGIDAIFASGASATYDLVVGADGVHSIVRALAFGAEEEYLRPMKSMMAVMTVPNHLGIHREQLLFSGVRQIASIKSSNANRDLQVAVFFPRPEGPFDHRDIPAQRRMVAGAFADVGWEFPRIIEGMMQARDFYSDITCQVRMESLYSRRVVLVGDAAYCPSPMSGQGSSLAIAGAFVLASELCRATDYRDALASYDAAMLPFARKNQDIALEIGGSFAPDTAFQLWMRRAAMRALPYMPGAQLMMKLAMRGIRNAARDLDLHRYDVAA